MSTDLNTFIQLELYPALYNNIPFAFPDMGFTMARDGWHSPKKMDGTEPRTARPDKCVITKKCPYAILEQGGPTMDLINFQAMRRGQSKIDAIKALAGVCGLQVPKGDFDSEEWKRRTERAAKKEEQAKQMSEALFTLPEAKPTLDYLRQARGYSDDKIKAMGLGYCSKSMAAEVEGAPMGAGEEFVLTVPCRDARGLYGFKLRSLDGEYRNTAGMEKSERLFGLTPTRLTKDKEKELVIVEGELDALSAQYAGLDNVVAASGGVVDAKALQDAKRLGYERIILLFDTEGIEAKKQDNSPERIKKTTKQTEGKIKKAVKVISEEGFKPFVATLPSENGEKVDADSYLTTHSGEDLRKVIAEARSGAIYLYNLILRDVIEKQGEGNTPTDALMSDFKDEVLRLLLDTKVVSPTDEDTILYFISGSTNGMYTKEALLKEKEAMRARIDGERRISDTIEAARKVLELAQKGKPEDSIELMGQAYNELRKGGKEEKFRRMLSLPTQDGIYEGFRSAPSGIPTEYVFSEGDDKERLYLPEGALTFVCAPSSHGKSTMLRNLALQVLRTIAKDGEEGTVLYYTLEEDFNSTLKLFVNTAFAKVITNGRRFNNLTTIGEYYKSGRTDTKYIRSDAMDFPDFEKRWIEENIVSGRLRIVSEADFDSKDLIDNIEYTASQLKVKAVFIDYIQLLFTDGNRKNRNEELRDICKELRRLSIRTSLPIIAAAQLNREAKSPIEMKLTTIADSIDIAREANIALFLWNSAFEADNGSAYDNPKARAQIAADKRPELGVRGSIYAVLRKNRGGKVNIDALLEYNGNTGEIKPNYKKEDFSEQFFSEPEQEDLLF